MFFFFSLSAVCYLPKMRIAPNLFCINGVSGKFCQMHELQVQRPKFSQDAAPGRRPSPVPTGAAVTEGETAVLLPSPTPCATATRNHGNKPTMRAGTEPRGWLESWQQHTKETLSVVKWQNRDKDAGSWSELGAGCEERKELIYLLVFMC